MIRFPRIKDKRRSQKLEVIAEHRCTLKHGYRKARSAMFKDNMLPLLRIRENFFLSFPI